MIHDPSLKIVGVIDNNKPKSLHFFDDEWERDLATGASVFSFSVYKKFTSDNELQRDPSSLLRKRNFVSFNYKGETFLFLIYKIKETRTMLELECRNLNLELINESALPFKSDQPLTFKQYAEKMDLLNFTKLDIGINEIASYTRTLEFSSSETKLARLLELLSKFNAEHEFRTVLNSDGTLKEFKLNVYKEYDGENYGVGKKQKNVILLGERFLTDITRTVDYDGLFTMLVPTSTQSVADEVSKSDEHGQKVTTVKNPDGSTTRTTVWTNMDGSQSKSVITTKVTKNADGSTTTVKRTEKANGSIIETTTVRTSKGNASSTTKVLKPPTSNKDTGEKELIDIASMPDWEVKNSDGEVEFYKKGEALYAPIASKLYPSTFTSETQNDQWIRKDNSYDADSSEILEQMAFKDLKLHAYPSISYEIEGWTDLDIGDRVPIQDNEFSPILIIEARVSKQKLSFTKPENSRTTYDNFKSLSSNLSADIQSRLAELVEDAKPYTIQVSTDNGTTFKNGVGESLVKAKLYKGNTLVTSDVSWRWALDGNATVGMQYLVKASAIKDTAVLTVSAYVGNNEVATTEITLTNVNDGANGAKGEKGDKGETGADGKDGKDGRGLERSEDFYQLTSIGTAPSHPMVGGRNLLRNSKGPFKPNKANLSNYDNWITYNDTSVYLENGKEYVISGETDGYFTSIHDGSKESDNVVLWLTNNSSVWAIVSDNKVNTTGTKKTWTHPTGTYYLRVNTYHKTAVKSVWNIQIEQGTTKTPYSQAPEDLGWSTDMKVPTADKRFLWKLHIDYFSDGTVAVTQPTIAGIMGIQGLQGLPGETGADGKTQYTHIAYADNATGGGFSQTDQTKAYIGMYQDFVEAGSNDPTKYLWSKWKGSDGAQGIPGKAGADGKTPYIHFAFASSADGKTDFSLTDGNQRYMGYYSDYTQADSSDYTKYKWVDRLANVQVGTRNLWIQSKATGGFVEEILPDNHITGQKKCYRIPNNKELAFNIEPDFSSRLYQKVTFSAWVKYENVVQGANNWNKFNCFKHAMVRKNSSTGATTATTIGTDYTTLGSFTGTSDWKYITYTYDYAANKSYDQLKTTIRFNLEGVKSGSAWVTGVMVQFGNVATGHVWAPEDIQADIDSKADSALTQEQLNALEAKRLQMEVELKAKATLEQVSELETFINNLKQEDSDGRQKIIEITKAIEDRVKDIEPIMEYSQKLKFMDTYITQGNGGMVIGANESTTKVVVTPDRISFQSGGSEVAYISQRMLHIDNGVFTMSLQLGHYITRAHPKNEYVNATYFVK